MKSLKVKKGDTVYVTTGKEGKVADGGIKGQTGKVIGVFPDDNVVIVEGLRPQIRHKKPKNAKAQGGRVSKEGPINASNVMVVCPKCGKPTRVGYSFTEAGEKYRCCKRKINGAVCGESLDKANKTDRRAADKKVEKKADKKVDKKAEKKEKKAKTE